MKPGKKGLLVMGLRLVTLVLLMDFFLAGTALAALVDNSDGTVTDTVTCLMWQQASMDIDNNGTADIMTWQQALAESEDLELPLGGYSDWRLPNIVELLSIVDYSRYNPAIDPSLFPDTISSGSHGYWLSTTDVRYTYYARGMSFDEGSDFYDYKSSSHYVRAVRGGQCGGSLDHLAVSNYKLANIHHKSDRFSIWMDVSVRGETRTDFCDTHTMSVLGDEGKRAILKDCDLPGDAASTPANSKRYRVEFEIDQDDDYPTAAFIKNGIVTAYEIATGTPQNLTGLDGLSVYGTTFDMKKDAWEFKNSDWKGGNFVSNNHRFGEIIASYIDEGRRDNFWDNVGSMHFKDWGTDTWWPFGDLTSDGLCYGLANSAIAQFNNVGSSGWGTGDKVSEWEDEIEAHWPDDQAVSPFKPFESGADLYEMTSKDGLKKIMYYFVVQDWFHGGNWVGEDGNWIVVNNFQKEQRVINELLEKGRPILTAFSSDEGGHAFAVTQLISWENHTKYVIWDNNRPFKRSSDKNGPYLEWYIDDNQDYNKSFAIRGGDTIGITGKQYGYPKDSDQVNKYTINQLMSTLMPSCFDSQNIYNLWDEECPGNLNAGAGVTTSQAVTGTTVASSSMSAHPNYLEVMLIGGTVDGVYNQATGQPVALVPEGEIENGQAVITSSMGGTYHLLYLPADITYQVEAAKDPEMPFCKVFVTIPGTDGTVQQLNYEHAELAEDHATRFSFIVGRNNTNLALQRTGGSTYPPDYNDTGDMTLDPPAGFSGYYLDGGPPMLSWDNSEHPDFSLVEIVRRTDTFPTGPADGVQVYSGSAELANDPTAVPGSICYYGAYSVDTSGGYSEAVYTAVDTTLFAVTGSVQVEGTLAAINGASLSLRNSEGGVIATTFTRKNGGYVLANLENAPYTLTVEKFGYTFSSSPQPVVINSHNESVNFIGTAVPDLEFVSDFDEVHIGNTAQVTWRYRNIADSALVKVQKIAGGVTTDLAEVPASEGYLLWDVAGPVADDVTLKVSLKTDTSVADTDDLKILSEQPSSSSGFFWPMFLPAIIGGAGE